MLSFNIVAIYITLAFSIGCISSSFVILYRWRSSAFRVTSANLRNVKHIPENEKAIIYLQGEEGLTYRCGKKHKPMVYFEYAYTVNGITYSKSYFYEEDDDPLPAKCKMYYHIKRPNRSFREGSTKNGVMLAGVLLFLGVIFLFASLLNLF